MNYEIITINGEEYKLRLRAMDQVALKKKLGKSLLQLVMEMQEAETSLDNFDLEELLLILSYSLKAHHKDLRESDVYALYDAYVDENGNQFTILEVIINVFAVSGVLPSEMVDALKKEREKGNLEE